MADALSLGVTYSSVQGRAYPLPLGARARPLDTSCALLSYPHVAWPSLCPTSISHAATTSEGVDYSTGLGLRLYNACIVGRVGLGHHPPTRPSLFLPHFYCGHAFVTPLLAWVRLSYPTSSVALRFVPPLRCAGASEVRPCPSPVGRAQLFPKRSNNFLVLGSSASLIGSELQGLSGSDLI